MIRILTGDDVARALPMSEAIKAVKSAFVELSQNGAVMPVSGSVQLPDHIEPANGAAEAVAEAVAICTAATSPTPAFNDADVRAGTHINAVGAYTPEMQEVPPETLLRARVVIEHLESALAAARSADLGTRASLRARAPMHHRTERRHGHRVSPVSDTDP